MNILVTGSNGFVGRNLVWNLKEIRDGKNRTRESLNISEIYGCDKDSTQAELEYACKRADFVFHLAGVSRPKNNSEFMEGNFGSAYCLLNMLKACGNPCPVMFSSSVQASLAGRFFDSEYGRSKLAVEELIFRYSEETGVKVLVYRFPNLFGKWCRADYNSAAATFCSSVANDLEYTVNDPNIEIELLYIDDLMNEMFDALEGREHRCEYDGMDIIPNPRGSFCYVPTTHQVSLGKIIELLLSFKMLPDTLFLPELPKNSFAKKLYSTYLSYLPPPKMLFSFKSTVDDRGSFTELMKTLNCGQFSVNVTKPGITRGQHWHNSKWEIFIVISGHGLIKERRIGIDSETGREYPVIKFEVAGRQLKAVQILPGYIHSITNLSDNQDLVTLIWANETFDESSPDTFYESVEAGLEDKSL